MIFFFQGSGEDGGSSGFGKFELSELAQKLFAVEFCSMVNEVWSVLHIDCGD
jgi:hypothetical protein